MLRPIIAMAVLVTSAGGSGHPAPRERDGVAAPAADRIAADSLHVLDATLSPLVRDFNAAEGSSRFVAILSPRCPACVHGARAIHDALLGPDGPPMPIFIVWTPMVPGDDEAAARDAMRELRSPGVRQYYDPKNAVGALMRHDVFPRSRAEMLASIPPDHFIARYLEQQRPDVPEWDLYMFFDARARWRDSIPRPARWARQVARFREPGGRLESLMWVNSYRRPPVEGELSTQIAALADTMRAGKGR